MININNKEPLPIGVSDFKKLILGKYQFVDKTNFIKETINDGNEVILITRPRRFGKTLNLSMLYYFLQHNSSPGQNLFENLFIAADHDFCQKHQNKYPVIFISFKDIKKGSFEQSYSKIVNLISKLYKEHRSLLEGDLLYSDEKEIFIKIINKTANQLDIEDSLVLLVEYLEKKFGNLPILLIDEYDTPIQEAYLRGYYQEMMDLMRSILGQALKDNSKIQKAIITGITRVAQESLFSGVNNLAVYSLLREKLGQYFGFTEKEVLKLLNDNQSIVYIDEIKEWYNGYQIGKHTLYNPWSILSCLDHNGELKPYWLNTSSNDLVKELLDKIDYSVKGEFALLLQGKTIEKPLLENLVFPELKEKEEAIWSLLLYAGYLNVISSAIKGFQLMAQVSIPNREVMYVYDGIIAGWFRKGSSLDTYKEFIQSLKLGEMAIFKKYLSEILDIGSYFDFNRNTPERVFHSFMLGLTVGLKDEYIIKSNQESGLGRFDVVFIPKNKQIKGILLEFKTSDKIDLLLDRAQEALEQIKDKQYFQIFKQHEVKNILAIGLAFCGKQLELMHEEMKIDLP